MALVLSLSAITIQDTPLAGGKGASLGEMMQAGLPVPPGFVILANAFDQFIAEAELAAEIKAALDSVNHEAVHMVEAASEKYQAENNV